MKQVKRTEISQEIADVIVNCDNWIFVGKEKTVYSCCIVRIEKFAPYDCKWVSIVYRMCVRGCVLAVCTCRRLFCLPTKSHLKPIVQFWLFVIYRLVVGSLFRLRLRLRLLLLLHLYLTVIVRKFRQSRSTFNSKIHLTSLESNSKAHIFSSSFFRASVSFVHFQRSEEKYVFFFSHLEFWINFKWVDHDFELTEFPRSKNQHKTLFLLKWNQNAHINQCIKRICLCVCVCISYNVVSERVNL